MLTDGVPFVEFAVFVETLSVDPGVVIFTKEAIAAKGEAGTKAVFFDGIEGVLRAAWTKVASWAVDLGDDALMEADENLADFDTWSGGGRWAIAWRVIEFEVDKVGIFSERGSCAVEREEEKEDSKMHIGTLVRGRDVF